MYYYLLLLCCIIHVTDFRDTAAVWSRGKILPREKQSLPVVNKINHGCEHHTQL